MMRTWILVLMLFLWSCDQQDKVIVEIRGVQYRAEIADNEIDRAKGLMHHAPLFSSEAMLFVYPSERHVSFWMKNVSFPLDIIFIDKCGSIVKIHDNAIPNDPTPISSNAPVLLVLEILGGASKITEIEIGDIVNISGRYSNLFNICDA